MDAHVRAALQAIDDAVETTRQEEHFPITPEHAADIAAMMAWPENQDGAVKDGIWATYVECRALFARARLVS
jgi:hypothetical protein